MKNNVKELKKLSRKGLFEIILEQLKRINELEEKVDKLEEKLKSKRININQSGSIAEAALKLSGIFETAQEACNEYLDNVNKNCELQEKARIKENEKLRRKMIKDTQLKCQKMLDKAREEIESQKQEVVTIDPKAKKVKLKIESTSKRISNEKKK